MFFFSTIRSPPSKKEFPIWAQMSPFFSFSPSLYLYIAKKWKEIEDCVMSKKKKVTNDY